MAQKNDINEQIIEGEKRKKRAEETYFSLMKKIRCLARERSDNMSEIARLVGREKSSKANTLQHLDDSCSKIMSSDLFLAFLDLFEAQIFFPDEEMPLIPNKFENDNNKYVKHLERIVDEQARIIRIYEQEYKK